MSKKKAAPSDAAQPGDGHAVQTLGEYLAAIRTVRKMTLREVQEATGDEVSNAYLSQLENNKISRPSPNILHALAVVYVIPYETLMEKAGYITPTSTSPDVLRTAGAVRHGRAATFTDANLTSEEEASLLEYLAFLRTRRGKGGKT